MARKLVYIVVALIILTFACAEVLIIYNGSSQEDNESEYLIILEAGLRGSEISMTLQERLLRGIEYLEKYPDAKAIVTGGQGPRETVPEAEAMERYMLSKGIDARRIIKEDKATSTWENFVFSRQILREAGKEDVTRIVVATSDFHMLRAKMLARRAGFEPYGIASGTPVSARFVSHVREYFALIKSFLFDR